MASVGEVEAQLSVLRAALAQLELLLRGLSNATLAPPSPAAPPPAAPPPRHPPMLSPPAQEGDGQELVLPLAIGGSIALVLLIIIVVRQVGLPSRLKIGISGLTAQRDEARPNKNSTQKKVLLQDDGYAQQRQEERKAQKDTDRQRLLDQIVGMGASETALAAGEPSAVVDIGELVSGVGSLDAALLAAVSHGTNTLEVKALLARGASPNAAFLDRCALALAARKCEPGVTRALLEAGALIDQKDLRGWTPLMHAVDAHCAAFSREAVLMLLLDAGAAVDVWGHDLKGPLDLMVAKQQQQLTAKDSSRASHIATSKITMLMHQKSGGGGSVSWPLAEAQARISSSDTVLPRKSFGLNMSERET